jgi:hypothetical protein
VWLWVGGIVAADFFAKSQLLSAVCHQVAFRAAQVPPLGFAALRRWTRYSASLPQKELKADERLQYGYADEEREKG